MTKDRERSVPSTRDSILASQQTPIGSDLTGNQKNCSLSAGHDGLICQLKSGSVDSASRDVLALVFNRGVAVAEGATNPHPQGAPESWEKTLETTDSECLKAILESLDDESLPRREADIPKAHQNTYEMDFRNAAII